MKTLLAGPRPGRSSALRAGEGRRARHPRAVGPHRIHRSDQRRQRRSVRRGPRVGCGQGRVLGHGRRADGAAEGHRVRRRVRHDCAGHAQELKTQALALKVGKRLRVMFSDNNAGIDDSLIGGVIDRKYHRLRLRRTVDVLRLERADDGERPRLRPDRRHAQGDGGLGSGRSASDDRHRQDDQGLLAGGGRRQDCRIAGSGGRLSQPSVRDEDELGVLRGAGEDVRGQATASSSRASATARSPTRGSG